MQVSFIISVPWYDMRSEPHKYIFDDPLSFIHEIFKWLSSLIIVNRLWKFTNWLTAFLKRNSEKFHETSFGSSKIIHR